MLPQTLFLTISLVDRFAERVQVKRTEYQLLGVTCLHIAAKYEEIYPPYLRHFVEITDGAYSCENIKDCEALVLETLDFNLHFPTSLRFLERYCAIGECSAEIYYLSRFMLELCMVEVKMNKWNPSMLASASIYISKKIKECSIPLSPFMISQTGHTEDQIRHCARDICFILNNVDNKSYYKSI